MGSFNVSYCFTVKKKNCRIILTEEDYATKRKKQLLNLKVVASIRQGDMSMPMSMGV